MIAERVNVFSDLSENIKFRINDFPVSPKSENIMWKGNPGNTFYKTRKEIGKKCYHEWETYFYVFCGGNLFLFWLSSFISRFSAAVSKIITSGKVHFSYFRTNGNSNILKVFIFIFLPGNIVRHDPYRTLLPGQRHHGRSGASGWPTRRWLWLPPTAG